MDCTGDRILAAIVAVVLGLINYLIWQTLDGIFNSPMSSLTVFWAIVTSIVGILLGIAFVVVCVIILGAIYFVLTGDEL